MKTELNVKLIGHTINPDLIIATAGKLCYSPSNIKDLMQKQTPESIERFVNMLVEIGHESPLEHVTFNFAIEGVSRSLTHQLVRHRIASYSQQSQRYVNLDKTFNYVIPKSIKKYKFISEIYINAMNNAFESYVEISRELLKCLVYDFLVENKKKYYLNGP